MEKSLTLLNTFLQETVNQLTGPLSAERLAALYDHSLGKLPDANLSELSSQSIDLLNRVEQLLEPSSLVLADHFLGWFPSHL